MGLILTNNAYSRLPTAVTASDTTLTLGTGHGDRFPSPLIGDWFPITIQTADSLEIVRVTARSGDDLTVVRGQEGTDAQDWPANTLVELRLTVSAVAEGILPVGTIMPWSRYTEPSGWILCNGRILLPDSPYGSLRNAYIADGCPFGSDGSGNPYIPDARGRVIAGLDNMGGTAAGRVTNAGAGTSGINGSSMGAAGGGDRHTLVANEMPSHTHSVVDGTHTHGIGDPSHWHATSNSGSDSLMARDTANGSYTISGGGPANGWTSGGISYAYTGIIVYAAYSNITIAANGGSAAHPNMQPTIMLQYIVKV